MYSSEYLRYQSVFNASMGVSYPSLVDWHALLRTWLKVIFFAKILHCSCFVDHHVLKIKAIKFNDLQG